MRAESPVDNTQMELSIQILPARNAVIEIEEKIRVGSESRRQKEKNHQAMYNDFSAHAVESTIQPEKSQSRIRPPGIRVMPAVIFPRLYSFLSLIFWINPSASTLKSG